MNIELSLPVNADLSAVSVLHAEEMIRGQLSPKDTVQYYSKDLFFTLHTPSQTFGIAMRLAHLLGYEVHIDTTFESVDEWKLVGRMFNRDRLDFDTYTVYSPGA